MSTDEIVCFIFFEQSFGNISVNDIWFDYLPDFLQFCAYKHFSQNTLLSALSALKYSQKFNTNYCACE